ncbi:MAG TPA: hypothetical protein VMF51_15915 [Nocardioides sp.]|uniref:hypothetical protein n=1 Tax=Nocardioides sp. TaxID=35761 RepID=UPI002BE3F8B4|nr:hypothetical protein [Nocardioides sp.]HTW16625.1 hypothetical protein [Nocardioides sp.]
MPHPHRPHRAWRRVLALAAGTTLLLSGLAVTAPPASAGQVGLTLKIRGAGTVQVVEGSIEDGGWTSCDRTANLDDRVVQDCGRIRNEEPFEAWIWLRAVPAPEPAGEWVVTNWDGCDDVRKVGETFECAVHSGAFGSVEKTVTANFSDVRSPTLTSFTQVRDTSAPGTWTYAWAADHGDLECAYESLSFMACSSPKVVPWDEGSHRFSVRAVDASGNTSAFQSHEVTVVDTEVISGPAARVASSTARFNLRTGAGNAFDCSLDGAAWSGCASGRNVVVDLAGLADGQHTLRARAKVGTWLDLFPVEHTWTVDTTAPVTTIGTTTHVRDTASIAFTAPGAALSECRLDGGSWGPCTSPATYVGLADGQHRFEVRSVDDLGNTEAVPVVHEWVSDSTVPVITLTGKHVRDRATLTFAAPGAASYSCRLDGGAWTVCTSPTSYVGLADGRHRFEVRATDGSGNVTQVPAVHEWVVDTTAPQTRFTSGPAEGSVDLRSSITLGIHAADAERVACTLDGASVPCGASLALARLRPGTHRVTATGVDAAGNADATPAARTWTVPLDDRALRKARGWKRVRSASAYGGSFLRASRRGASVSVKVRGARSLILVAGPGKGSGKVTVLAGKRRLRTVTLPTSRTPRLVPVATLAKPFSGKLRIVVAGGRQVRLDGLGVVAG